MKKIPLIALAIGLLIFSSCSEKFKVAAPYKSITVVYGLLDMSDTAHYVRIQKAFLDENKSAIDMATNPDSNYFRQLNVIVREISNGTIVNNISLARVNLADEGYQKDSGAFFSTPNYAYKFKDTLNAAYTYRLVIYNPVTGETDSAETPVITNDPTVFYMPFFDRHSEQLEIARTSRDDNFSLSGSAPPNAVAIQCTFRFYYVERNVVNGAEQEKYVDWIRDIEQLGTGNKISIEIPNVTFYTFLHAAIGPPGNNIERYLDSVNLSVIAITSQFYNYIQVANAQNSGITSFEAKPVNTNMQGANVLGLFTSRVLMRYNNIYFDQNSIDSLEVNSITSGLNIRGLYVH